MFLRHSLSLCVGLLGLFAVNQAMAGISLSSTRLIFDGNHKEASITVRNSGADVLVQSWVDTDSDEAGSAPFAVTPPLVRSAAINNRFCGLSTKAPACPATASQWCG